MVPEPRFSNGVSGLLVPRSRSAPGGGVSNGGGRGYGVRRTGEVAPSDVQNWVSHAVRSPEKACDVLESVEGVDLYKRWSMAPGRPEPREAVSCCASLL
jgi:hypothetical protein